MKRKILLVLGLALTISACATAPQTATSALTFVHLNDTYRVGAVEDGNAGGFSRVVTVVRELQSQGRDVRILHGGDFLYPSLESQLWNGLQMVDAFNFMDAVAPLYAVSGNHEFDRRGPEQLIAAVEASQFDWVGDNYVFKTGNVSVDSALKTAFTFESADKTIGVFSLTLNPADGGNERS
ncbi:MAG: metallophosphoesterase, partial [Woeseiaceae bacterium]